MAVELGEHTGLRWETWSGNGGIVEVGAEAEDVMVAHEGVVERRGFGIEVIGWTDDGVMVNRDLRRLLLLLLLLGGGYVCVCPFVVRMRG